MRSRGIETRRGGARHPTGAPWRRVRRGGLGACLAVALLLAAGSCATGGTGEAEALDGEAPDDTRLFVRIDNDTSFRLTIYLLTEVQAIRLGEVGPIGSETLEVPGALAGGSRRYRLQADPVGSVRCYRSEDVFAAPGDVIRWRLWGDPTSPCVR